MPQEERFLRLAQVQARVPWSRATINLKIKRGEFPGPHRLGARSIAWLESDISAWIAGRIETSNDISAEVTK